MSRNIYRVKTKYGIEVTRQSDRPYKFVIISFGQSEAFLRSRHEAKAKYLNELAARYRIAERTGTDPKYPQDGGRFVAEDYRRWAEDTEAKAAIPFVAEEAKLMVHGWSMSMKGAMAMEREAVKYRYLNIEVLPVA